MSSDPSPLWFGAGWTGEMVRTGHLLELGPTTIRVEGCAIGICGGQNMTRIK
jgi:hypothetical protein